jgi:hypothetical protein
MFSTYKRYRNVKRDKRGKRKGTSGREKGEKEEVGNDLLSHAVARILPSALAGLTAGFEMGPGVPPPLLSPTNFPSPYPPLPHAPLAHWDGRPGADFTSHNPSLVSFVNAFLFRCTTPTGTLKTKQD